MNYGTIATSVNEKVGKISDGITDIQAIDFESVWSGPAYATVADDFSKIVSKLEEQVGNVHQFVGALEKLQTYSDNKDKISNLNSSLSSIPNTKENASQRSSLSSQISALEKENSTLKSKIESILSSFSAISSDLEVIHFDIDDFDGDVKTLLSDDFYLYDLSSLTSAYSGHSLQMLSVGDSLYNYYNQVDANGNVIEGSGKAYVEGVIQQIQQDYSGREAAVNSALAILQLAADKNLRINYQHKGTTGVDPYVPTASVASGVDCNPFVSWCLDKGTPGGFQWRPVSDFTSIGNTVSDWTQAQPGDVLANGGHVALVVENDTENGKFVIAHAGGTAKGICTATLTYNNLINQGYTVRDMTDVYDGSVNTDRWSAFAPYVDPSTFQRKA